MTDHPDTQRLARRKRGFRLLFTVILIAVGAWALQRFVLSSPHESTDNAYVGGDQILITPRTSGTVTGIHAGETGFLQAGELLVTLDDRTARIRLDEARATLAQTVRELARLHEDNRALHATVELRRAELEKARQDLQRRQRLKAGRTLSEEELTNARIAENTASAALDTALRQLDANRALIGGVDIARHPRVQADIAALREANLQLSFTRIHAPMSGFVARKNVQLGNSISPGQALLAIVPLDNLWVDANFKESQLATLRIDQPVTLTSDVYGSDVVFHGKVRGISAGTGGAFALLPAQNATGNWVKVVQRVPVRIALDPEELKKHPLRIGLSMHATVDIRQRNGTQLNAVSLSNPVYDQPVDDKPLVEANAMAEQIITANLPRPTP